jgi:hypothetical protein
MSLSDSRRQSHGYTITANTAVDVSLPTPPPRAPIHEDITVAYGEDVSRPNSAELRHGSMMIASGGQEESPSNSRKYHHRGITSIFYVHKMSLKTSKDKVRCLHFHLKC